jgi:hypothetical protein
MTPLRQRMLEDMQVRNLAINTQTTRQRRRLVISQIGGLMGGRSRDTDSMLVGREGTKSKCLLRHHQQRIHSPAPWSQITFRDNAIHTVRFYT